MRFFQRTHDKELLTLGMDEKRFEICAMQMCRSMFLAGVCFGAAVTGLASLHAYGILGVLIALCVVGIAWHGWPWDM